jgi:predicted LPLAT superfamily acyltransferase
MAAWLLRGDVGALVAMTRASIELAVVTAQDGRVRVAIALLDHALQVVEDAISGVRTPSEAHALAFAAREICEQAIALRCQIDDGAGVSVVHDRCCGVLARLEP